MTYRKLPFGAMPRQTKRTTVRDYDADLLTARALLDERAGFLYSGAGIEPEIYEQTWKSIDDALNNEWQRNITIERWVERAMEATNQRPRRP